MTPAPTLTEAIAVVSALLQHPDSTSVLQRAADLLDRARDTRAPDTSGLRDLAAREAARG
jgi:hypothetical protein